MQYLTLTKSKIFRDYANLGPAPGMQTANSLPLYYVLAPQSSDPVAGTTVICVPDWVLQDPTYTAGIADGSIVNFGAAPAAGTPTYTPEVLS